MRARRGFNLASGSGTGSGGGGGPPVATLPSPTYFTPAGNPAAQAFWDTAYSPPLDATTPANNAPIISKILPYAGYQNLFAAAGWQWTSDTIFLVFGQTMAGDGNLKAATLLMPTAGNLSNNEAVLAITGQANTSTMYLVWVQNSAGTSIPVVMNRAEFDTILCPDTGNNNCIPGTPGSELRLFGRNLLGPSSNCSVWFEKAGVGAYITPSSVTKYEVRVNIGNLAAGTYNVSLHNGHGGKYGWSASRQIVVGTLAAAGVDYSATVVNVAPTDGGGDFAVSAAAALATIGNGNYGTIQLQDGNYIANSPIDVACISAKVWFKGTGKTTCKIKSGFDQLGAGLLRDANGLSKYTDLTVDTTTHTQTGGAAGIAGGRIFKNLKLDQRTGTPNISASLFNWNITCGENAVVTGCDMYGWGVYNSAYNGSVLIASNNFFCAMMGYLAGGGGTSGGPIGGDGAGDVAITDNVVNDLVLHGSSLSGTDSYTVANALDGTTVTFHLQTNLGYVAAQNLLAIPTDSPIGQVNYNNNTIIALNLTVVSYVAGTGVLTATVNSHTPAKALVSVGSPSAGTFTLTLGGQTTAAIAYNAPANPLVSPDGSSIKEKIEALSNVGSGKTTVSGATGGPWTIAFATPASTVVSGMTINGGGLTGGSASVAEVASGTHNRWWVDGLDTQRSFGRFVNWANFGVSARVFILRNTVTKLAKGVYSDLNGGEKITRESTPENLAGGHGDATAWKYQLPPAAAPTAVATNGFTFPNGTITNFDGSASLTGISAIANFDGAHGSATWPKYGPKGNRNSRLVVIRSGRGQGQASPVLSIDGSNNVVVEGNGNGVWDVMPDLNSSIAFYACAWRWVVDGNTISGIPNIDNASQMTALEGAVDCIFSNNTASDMLFGHGNFNDTNHPAKVDTPPLWPASTTYTSESSWNLYDSNTYTNIGTAILRDASGYFTGNIFRNTTVNGDGVSTYVQSGWFGNWNLCDICAWETGVTTDVLYGVQIPVNVTTSGILLYNTTFARGQAPAADSGVTSALTTLNLAGQPITMKNVTWTNFQTSLLSGLAFDCLMTGPTVINSVTTDVETPIDGPTMQNVIGGHTGVHTTNNSIMGFTTTEATAALTSDNNQTISGFGAFYIEEGTPPKRGTIFTKRNTLEEWAFYLTPSLQVQLVWFSQTAGGPVNVTSSLTLTPGKVQTAGFAFDPTTGTALLFVNGQLDPNSLVGPAAVGALTTADNGQHLLLLTEPSATASFPGTMYRPTIWKSHMLDPLDFFNLSALPFQTLV